MTSWRDRILNEFTPNAARLTLVADPDGLLLEERMLEGIRQRGFELLPYDDPVAFRYAYESEFRNGWAEGEQRDLVVVVGAAANRLGDLPYDVLQAGRRLSFTLADVFPALSYAVVAALDRGDLDALYEAQERHAPGQLGENATKEFILRHIFDIAPELIKQPSDLLRVLLRRHYRDRRVPPLLDARFIHILRQSHRFDDWPIETLATDREAFFTFLQERWPIFLDRTVAEGEVPCDGGATGDYQLTVPGCTDLPFDHPDVRVYIDNLFVEGLLATVPHARAAALAGTWAGIGVCTDPSADHVRRVAKLIESLQASIPAADARHAEWQHFAHRWAELVVLATEHDPPAPGSAFEALQARVDAAFAAWLSRRYAGLVNLPPVPPVMLHHLARFLARRVEDGCDRMALVVVDGLSLDQWLVVRHSLAARQPDWVFREHSLFAWVPSITSVSRQAIFAGRPPFFFPNSIQTTGKEPLLWSQFWADHGLPANEVVYARGLGDDSLEAVSDVLAHPKVKVAGLVVDKVDKIMHGMELGMQGMHNQVRLWSEQPYLSSILAVLLDRGFHVYLTSDHGNIEARGCGRPAEGAVAELRGERVRVYPDAGLRSNVKARFPAAIEWKPIGLPAGYWPLIAGARQAFVGRKDRIVSHGGISIEEMIVPFVEIERRLA